MKGFNKKSKTYKVMENMDIKFDFSICNGLLKECLKEKQSVRELNSLRKMENSNINHHITTFGYKGFTITGIDEHEPEYYHMFILNIQIPKKSIKTASSSVIDVDKLESDLEDALCFNGQFIFTETDESYDIYVDEYTDMAIIQFWQILSNIDMVVSRINEVMYANRIKSAVCNSEFEMHAM